MDAGQHWEQVYATKGEQDVSWFEALPALSLQMMEAAGLTRDTCVIDVGGGESRLVDTLAARGLDCLAVLDISQTAIERTRARLGARADGFTWLSADVTGAWTLKPMDIWHDRAVFHFLIDSEAKSRYLAHLRETLKPRGTAIIATFGPDGPARCSGLPVVRYSAAALAGVLGPEFELMETVPYAHTTPWGAVQSFQYSRFARRSADRERRN